MKIRQGAVFFLLIIQLVGCRTDHHYLTPFTDPSIYNLTVKELNNVVLENNFPPMIASRNYAYANIAAYECIAGGDSKLKTLAGRIRHMPPIPRPPGKENVDHHLAALLAFTKVGNAVTFPEGSMMEHHERLLKMADSMGVPLKVRRASANYADAVSDAILEWSRGDRYATTRGASRFIVKDSAGRWVPTPPMYATGLEPHWREIRTMVLDSASQCKPGRPPVFDLRPNSVYFNSLMEVKKTVDNLTSEQKEIADFWDDNPFKMNVAGHVQFATRKISPAGHWMNIVGMASLKAKADFSKTISAHTHTAIAIFDAFISCWDEKYRSNYVRPETIINEKISADWHPYIQTPPFPSYTSGHSTISAAAAEIMTKFYGDALSFPDTSLKAFGIPGRQIISFRKAAEEASISRLYGGIHYRFDLDSGNVAGRKVGEIVVQRLLEASVTH